MKFTLTEISRNRYRIDVVEGRFNKIDSLKISGCYYSSNEQAWVFPATEGNYTTFQALFSDVSINEMKESKSTSAFDDVKNNKKAADNFDAPKDLLNHEANYLKTNENVPLTEKVVYVTLHTDVGEIEIKFEGGYRKEWLSSIRKHGNIRFDKVRKSLFVKDLETTYKDLMCFLQSLGIAIVEEKLDGATKSIAKTNRKPLLGILSDSVGVKGLSPLLEQINIFEKWMRQRRYAENTISTYVSQLKVFFKYYSDRNPASISVNDIETFNYEFIIKQEYSITYQNQTINALKKYYLKMLGVKQELENLERPKGRRALPKVIPVKDVKKFLGQIANPKHKTALSVIYSLGLRRGELLNLRLSDIDFKTMTVSIRNAKGRKDRTVPLSDKLAALMQHHINVNNPKCWLIEGEKPGKKFSATSLQNTFKNNFEKIQKNHSFTLHCLRHSIATHLLDSGVDLRLIQELLGHESSRTTEIYTHVSIQSLKKIRNPFDEFEI